MRSVLAGAAAIVGGALLPLAAPRAAPRLLLSCFFRCAAASSSAAAAPVTVRLGYLANITHAPALIGVKNGYFAKELGSAGT